MSDHPFVAFNVLTVPEPARATLEERFAKRAGEVETMPGFRHFELLRPVDGTDRYLVYTQDRGVSRRTSAGPGMPAQPADPTDTRWDSKADFEAWVESMAFKRGHAEGEGQAPAASGSEVWTFEAIQMADVETS